MTGFLVDLECYLTFFIIEDLLTLAKVSFPFPPHNDARVTVIRLSLNLLRSVLIRDIEYYVEKLCSSRIEHLLDFVRICLVPSELPVQRKLKTLSIPSVTQLYQSGVKFRVVKHGNSSDISFHEGILDIPHLYVCTSTESLLRNVTAYERCHLDDGYMSNFAFLLDRLIDSPRDVDILINDQILETNLSDSQEVATLLYNLTPGGAILGYNSYFADLCDDLDAYCRVPWHKWKATLKKEYFSTPWSVISVIAVTLLLFLTFLQTAFTIYSGSCH